MGTQLYGYTRNEHEYSVNVPQIMTDDSELTIYISAHGGGTVGQAYAGNGWDYAVYDSCNGENNCACHTLILEGSDIRSPAGRPAGHAETARSLASFLSAAGESFASYPAYGRSDSMYADDYDEIEREWLAANYERLSMFADES